MVAIPRPLLAALKLHKGDHVALVQVGESVAVIPMELVLRARVAEQTAAVHAGVAELKL